jgi:DNA repair protein RadA/Sms
VFGEISLSGDIRPVSRMEARLKEALKLGFSRALCPQGAEGGGGMAVTSFSRLAEVVAAIGEGEP